MGCSTAMISERRVDPGCVVCWLCHVWKLPAADKTEAMGLPLCAASGQTYEEQCLASMLLTLLNLWMLRHLPCLGLMHKQPWVPCMHSFDRLATCALQAPPCSPLELASSQRCTCVAFPTPSSVLAAYEVCRQRSGARQPDDVLLLHDPAAARHELCFVPSSACRSVHGNMATALHGSRYKAWQSACNTQQMWAVAQHPDLGAGPWVLDYVSRYP